MKNRKNRSLWITRVLAVMALVSVVFGPASPARAEDNRDFDVVNRTSTPLQHLFVTYPWDPKLTDDLVPASGAISVGATVPVTFSTPSSHCIYDVHAVGQNGRAWAATNVDLCTTASVTFTDQRVIVDAANSAPDDEEDCAEECDEDPSNQTDAPEDATY